MQSIQSNSTNQTSTLDLNASFLKTRTGSQEPGATLLNHRDSVLLDSLRNNYIAPDSVIIFGYKQEWSQFRKEYTPKFNYQRDLIRPIPFDSLQTVLQKVEVVFPGKKLIRSNPDWLVGVILIAFLLFASVRLIFNKYLNQLLQSITNYSTFSRLFRERYFNLLHASFRLDLVFCMIMSLFGYQFMHTHQLSIGGAKSYSLYLSCLSLVIGYFIVKKFIYFLVGILTESKPDVQEYLFCISTHTRVLGLFLLPVTAVIAFVPMTTNEVLFYIGIFIIAVFYLLSLIRGGKIFLKKHFSISYLILYLCTLEFLPLILLYFIVLN